MVPKVKVLGVFARTDGELVADLIELTVQCQLENQVRCPCSLTELVKGRIQESGFCE